MFKAEVIALRIGELTLRGFPLIVAICSRKGICISSLGCSSSSPLFAEDAESPEGTKLFTECVTLLSQREPFDLILEVLQTA